MEVCLLGQWRPVCDEAWLTNSVIVACRQLGLDIESKGLLPLVSRYILLAV